MGAQPDYALGHSDQELARLLVQGRYWGDFTEAALLRAGLRPGMRVLDVGCGAGDVSFIAASIVGPSGSVVGIDPAPEAVKAASSRAYQIGLRQASFIQARAEDYHSDEPFDLLVARFVAVHLTEPALTLGRLAGLLRLGGTMVLQELDITAARSRPAIPLFNQAAGWVAETFRRAGLDPDMGSALWSLTRKAGLPPPRLRVEGRIEPPPGADGGRYVAQTVRAMLPLMEKLGITTPAEAAVDTLAARLREAVEAADAVLVSPDIVTATCVMP